MDKSEILQDLLQLSTTFGHIEKLVTLAASLHRKFPEAPRLAEEIFNDCFNAYLPRMGTASINSPTVNWFHQLHILIQFPHCKYMT